MFRIKTTDKQVSQSEDLQLGSSTHYSRHSNLDSPVSHSLLHSGDSTRRQCELITPHFVLLGIPGRSCIKLRSCCLIEVESYTVQPSLAAQAHCCCVACVRSLAFHKKLHQRDCLFWQFYHLIKNGV